MTLVRSRPGRWFCALVVGAAALIAHAAPKRQPPRPDTAKDTATAVAASPSGWIDVDYAALVDARRLSHSGESVGMLLQRLEGRPVPRPGERPEDLVAHILLNPILEPYAFILSDALDLQADRPTARLEIGSLWQPGEAQPGWVELLRSRHFLVESDGAGRIRACLPWMPPSESEAPADGTKLPDVDSADAAKQAWEAAWPVLRHVLTAERRRLGRKAGNRPEDHPIDIECYAYVAYPARTLFHLGVRPYREKIEDTRGTEDHPAPDLRAWASFLERGLQLEGGRLEPDGTVRLLGSDPASKPTLLGRPPTLADLAIAYRAVFHGGLGEPYMSLDRGNSPQISLVNYGGRLQDTSLGLVSLLCDVRFKTFSLGIDVMAGQDMRERLRRELPEFRTHIERFGAMSKGLMAQQTRLWFYPDSVDLTLSRETDVLVMRRARMSAASERVQQETPAGGRNEPDPPWTSETVAAINRDYDALSRFFSELNDLDQVVRLLSFFTWLREAGAEGLTLPDLDLLLAVELPAQPTPRHFPQLLAYNALPPSGSAGTVQVISRLSVGEALDLLQPASGAPLPALRRFRRALASLDRKLADHAALARELEGYDVGTLDESTLDILSYRAERLKMHQLVLNTLPASERTEMERRKKETEGLRTISVGIGGLDLGMGQALARAAGRNQTGAVGTPLSSPEVRRPVSGAASRRSSASSARRADPAGLPELAVPDHEGGLAVSGGGAAAKTAGSVSGGGSGARSGAASGAGSESGPGAESGARTAAASDRFSRPHWVQTGSAGTGEAAVSWLQSVAGADGPDPRARRLVLDAQGRVRRIERLESHRYLRYRLEPEGTRLRARPVDDALPMAAAEKAADPRGLRSGATEDNSPPNEAPVPSGLMLLQVQGGESPAPKGTGPETSSGPEGAETRGDSAGTEGQRVAAALSVGETSAVRLKLRAAAGRELSALFPRSVLQRLVLGHGVDLTPERPLSGLSPSQKVLGENRTLMVMIDRSQALPPWTAPLPVVPGEEDPARLAFALRQWWLGEGDEAQAPATTVGTDSSRSLERWQRVTGVGRKSALLLPDEAFPASAKALRESVAAAWKGSPVASSLSATEGASLVVLVSAEDPALLGGRLRYLARSPSMKGRLLAAFPLGGPVRPDLPASLLAEGNLAALGLADYSPVGPGRIVEQIRALAAALTNPSTGQKRPEEIVSPLLWYY